MEISYRTQHRTFQLGVMIGILSLIIFLVQGCAGISELSTARLPIQYATIKVIQDSEGITSSGVVRYVSHARALIDRDVQINAKYISAEIVDALQSEELSPADQFLAEQLILQIEIQLEDLNLLDNSVRLSLLDILDWVEEAAGRV